MDLYWICRFWDFSRWPEYRGGHISEVQIRGSSLYSYVFLSLWGRLLCMLLSSLWHFQRHWWFSPASLQKKTRVRGVWYREGRMELSSNSKATDWYVCLMTQQLSHLTYFSFGMVTFRQRSRCCYRLDATCPPNDTDGARVAKFVIEVRMFLAPRGKASFYRGH